MATFSPQERTFLLSWRQMQRWASKALMIHKGIGRAGVRETASVSRSDSPMQPLGAARRDALAVSACRRLHHALVSVYHPSMGICEDQETCRLHLHQRLSIKPTITSIKNVD